MVTCIRSLNILYFSVVLFPLMANPYKEATELMSGSAKGNKNGGEEKELDKTRK